MLSAFAVYLALHFLAYLTLLRSMGVFRTERAIFLYHFIPATTLGLAGLAYAFAEPATLRLAQLVLALSAHGIYSISFLELWSLAQGGYSLSVLRSIASGDGYGADTRFAHLERIGETKQRERIAGLAKLGLIAERGGTIALTTRGGLVAFLLDSLHRWIDPNKGAGKAA